MSATVHLHQKLQSHTSSSVVSSDSGGKFTSILAYLDEISEHVPDRAGRVPPPADDETSSSAVSHIVRSRCEQEVGGHRRLKCAQHARSSPSQATVGRESRAEDEGCSTSVRAPWDSSTQTDSSSRTTAANRRDLSKTAGCSSARDPVHTPKRSGKNGTEGTSALTGHGDAAAPLKFDAEYVSSRQDESVATLHRHFGDKHVDVPSHNHFGEGTGLVASGSGDGRRWVWDEWDLDDLDFASECNARRSKQHCRPRSAAVTCQRLAHSSPYAARPRDTVGRALSPREGGRNPSSGGCAGLAPPARQAFDSVQATARALRQDLKERRSEVLDLKTSLQRIRASNERRRAKLSARWAEKAAAAVAERESTREGQTNFTRQLQKDVEGLDEKLAGLERQIGRYREGRGRDCALARAQCARDLKKAREDWMKAEKARLQKASEKKLESMKQAAVRALEPQLSELVKENRAEARARSEDVEAALLGLQATLERENREEMQEGVRTFQESLVAEAEEERRQGEHQLKLLARTNEAESQEFREGARRDLEGERVRFEASRKRARDAASKEVEALRAAEAERTSLTLAEHGRELREAEEAFRQEEEDTRRRLAQKTQRWQRQIAASARKEARNRHDARLREARDKCNEELTMVLTRLETEASRARDAGHAEAQRASAVSVEARAKELSAAQDLESKAMDRYLESARRQAELESETQGLERETKAAKGRALEEAEKLAAMQEQTAEERLQRRVRLERLQEECAEERKAARAETSRLSGLAEEAEAEKRRCTGAAQDELIALQASLSDEFAQVEAKVDAVLKKKMGQAETLRERLGTLQAQTKAREEELADHRRRTFS